MKKMLLWLALLLPNICYASDISTEYAISLDNYYGYTDYDKLYKSGNKNNNLNSSLNLYGKVLYDINNNYSASIIGYIMADTAKEVENYNQGIWGEEIYGLLDTPYGELSFGQLQNVAYNFSVGAPNIGNYKINNTDLVNFINNPNWYKKDNKYSYKTLNSTYINTDGASLKINYVTPDFKGIKLGASYIPQTYSQSGLVAKKSLYKNESAYVLGSYGFWDILGYEIETSLGFADYDKNDTEYSAGISVYRKGITFGASYRKTKTENNDYAINRDNLFDAYRDGEAYNLGVSYAIGPFTTGISYFNSKSNISQNKDEIISFSNSYDYNKNTTLSLTIAHLEARGENKDYNKNNKGYAFVIGVELSLW